MSDETKTEFPQCPRCGWSTDPKLKPSEEDVKEYFRSVLGCRLFSKTYELVDGKIKMTFSTVSSEAQAESERVTAGLDLLPDREANSLGMRTRLLYHLRSIALDGKELSAFDHISVGSLEEVPAKFKARFGAFPAPLLDMAARSLLLFLELNRELLAAAFDENFWKGAGPR